MNITPISMIRNNNNINFGEFISDGDRYSYPKEYVQIEKNDWDAIMTYSAMLNRALIDINDEIKS